MTDICDSFGNAVLLKDKVSYSRGSSGAKEFFTGTVTKITAKSVVIRSDNEVDMHEDPMMVKRGYRCFTIDIMARSGIIGKANAWDSMDRYVSRVGGEARKLRDEVSLKLHEDGCASAAVHNICFIEKLIEHYEETHDRTY